MCGLQPQDAENVGQEVFLAVSRNLESFRHDQSRHTFRGWIRVITRNKIRDLCNKRGPAQAAGGSVGAGMLDQISVEDPGDTATSVEAEQKILHESALNMFRDRIKPRDWEAFYRTTVQNQTPKDVAEDLGVSVNVVYLARSRVLKRLREEFQDLLD